MQTQLTQVQSGWTAFDNRGDKVGEIVETSTNYVVVQKGLFLPSDVYVPLSAVSDVSAADEKVTLNVAKGDIDSMGWNEPPVSDAYDTRTASTYDTTTPAPPSETVWREGVDDEGNVLTGDDRR